MFDRVVDNIKCDKVIINDFEAAKHATTKLIEKNRKNIAFVSTIKSLKVGQKREDGYRNTLLEYFNVVNENLILNIDGDKDYQLQIKNFVLKNPEIDAVLSADNISGTMVINIVNSLNYNVPNDIAVIGFSDETISNLTVPKLSYINQEAQQIGSKAVDLLVSRLNLAQDDDRVETVNEIPFAFFDEQST